MSSRASGCSEGSLNADDLLEIRSRFEELAKEKELWRDSKSESFELIRRMEFHAKTLHDTRQEDKKRINELERELSNCSQEIDYLRDQLHMRNSDLNCLGEQVYSLQLKLAETEDLADEVERSREQVKVLEYERSSLIQEIEDKEFIIRFSDSRIEKLEESISSVELEYEFEIETAKLESVALEQNLSEVNKLLENTTRENSKMRDLIEDLEFRIQDANKMNESLVKENKNLKEKLKTAEKKFQEWLEIKDQQSLSTPELNTSTYNITSYPTTSDADTKNKIDEYELLVKQLKEEIRNERLKGKEEAEDLIQEMAELRYQLTARLEEECKRRASIEQISLHRIAELEAQIRKEEQKSIVPR